MAEAASDRQQRAGAGRDRHYTPGRIRTICKAEYRSRKRRSGKYEADGV